MIHMVGLVVKLITWKTEIQWNSFLNLWKATDILVLLFDSSDKASNLLPVVWLEIFLYIGRSLSSLLYIFNLFLISSGIKIFANNLKNILTTFVTHQHPPLWFFKALYSNTLETIRNGNELLFDKTLWRFLAFIKSLRSVAFFCYLRSSHSLWDYYFLFLK